MKTINTLPPHLISKIAAGEVADRPASIIKELVENAIDADASYITVNIERAGIAKITIRDNGIGMSADDLLVCTLPHTTSKIKHEEDLQKISSLGFRGEALSSIASVSNVIIKSRLRGTESGNELHVLDGKIEDIQTVGIPEGTEIVVDHLFSSVPARKKFLKDVSGELRAVIDVMTSIALGNPRIGFKFVNDAKTIFQVPESQRSENRMRAILGEDTFDQSFPISHQSRYGTISGFIGHPQIALHNKSNQHLFINSRSVRDASISQAVTEAFGSLIEPRTHPTYILFIDMPHDHVDVNTHPRKEEIAFMYPEKMREDILTGVKTTLDSNDLTYRTQSRKESFRDRGMDYHTASMLRDVVTPWNLKDNLFEKGILQIKNLYLVTMTDNGLLIVDQHAAHERILFEQFKEAFAGIKGEQPRHELPQALTFEISPSDAYILQEQLETFQKLGFDIESFGGSTFKLNAVPELFKERTHLDLIREVINDLKDKNTIKDIDRETERTLAYLACRTAIKAGDPLAEDERTRLIEKLLHTKGSYTCPHGRPTHIELPLSHLDKLFKRS